MVCGSVREQADIAYESGCLIHHTFPTPHCLPDHQERVRLDFDCVTGIHSDAPHKAGVGCVDSHYELICTTHTDGVNGGCEGVRRTGEGSLIQESIVVGSAPCQ